jgi:hypothetical protein
MSRVLNIIVEGPTERDFVTQCLMPYLANYQIYNVRPISIETSPGYKGGDVSYKRYSSLIKTLLRGKEDMLVTSLIDFYRLNSDFPKFNEAIAIVGKQNRISFHENVCFDDINDVRYIPYIQLHEFESLLFTKFDGFEFFSDIPNQNKSEIKSIINQFPNPELINDRPQFAPSERLKNLIPNYDKPFYGNFIILENGFESILEKCPRFSNWLGVLIERMKA